MRALVSEVYLHGMQCYMGYRCSSSMPPGRNNSTWLLLSGKYWRQSSWMYDTTSITNVFKMLSTQWATANLICIIAKCNPTPQQWPKHASNSYNMLLLIIYQVNNVITNCYKIICNIPITLKHTIQILLAICTCVCVWIRICFWTCTGITNGIIMYRCY